MWLVACSSTANTDSPAPDGGAADAASGASDGGASEAATSDGASASPPRTRVTFAGIGPAGIFDPSLSSAATEARVWMSYSEVLPSPMWSTQNAHAVRTRLARTDDQGATFVDVVANPTSFLDVTLPLAPPNNAGTWVAEVSSLAWDEGAAAPERWRIVFHRYLLVNGNRMFEHGWIGMKSAATPESLAAATEVKLFVGSIYDTSNDAAGGTSRSPVGGAPILHAETSHADLSGCVAFTEPSLFATATALEIALSCVNSSAEARLVRFRCDAPCTATKAASWTYAGTLLTTADAVALGYDSGFGAASLVRTASGGRALIATPTKSTPFAGFYDGCLVYPLTATGALAGSARAPSLVVPGIAGAFRGACDYSPKAAAAGILLSELDLGAPDSFRLFATHLAIF